MSTLRKFLKRPNTYLGFLIMLFLLIGLDVNRQPENQVLVNLYVTVVCDIYQPIGRPMQRGIICCRYSPSCSDYSILAVEKYGIGAGLILSVERIMSCTTDVPMGTIDLP